MKKVVLVTNIPSPYRVDLFYYMQKHMTEYEIYVIYTSKSEDNRQWSVDEAKMLNSTVLKSKIIKIKGGMDNRYIHIPTSIGKELNMIHPDVVIAFEYNPAAIQCFMWCKIHKVPLIHLTDGTLNSEKNIGKVQKFTRKLITKGASSCIASSTKAKEKLIFYGVPEKQIFLSLLTVSIDAYERTQRSPVPGRLLYVGSMIKRKGLDLLINSLSYVKEDFELHIVGNGTTNEIENLKKVAEEKGVSDKILWCGYKEGKDLVNEYMEASVFVLPTREDCFGLVLLEAMYAGVPIVSSKFADGAYDVVVSGVNGLIEDPFDAEMFANAIDNVLRDKNYAKNAIKCSAEKFSFKEVALGYKSAIDFTTN